MEATISQSATQSVNAANQLFGLLIHTLLAAQSNISPPDHGTTVTGQGSNKKLSFFVNLIFYTEDEQRTKMFLQCNVAVVK